MKKLIITFLLLISFSPILSQTKIDTLFIAFWNTENFFDTVDDPKINDEEFLPGAERQWTEDRFDKKMYHLARIIRMMNQGKGPDIMGFCEIENQNVLDTMVSKYLSDLNYSIAYLESPDKRGIDNGLIFKSSEFSLINIQADTVHLSDNWPTRLIFGVNLLTKENKKLTVFVNHWPSRSGGQIESESKRISAANTLKNDVDRIFSTDKNANIVIIGDFNDDPVNTSVLDVLRANPIKCDSLPSGFEMNSAGELFNLSYQAFENGLGSFKYKDIWNMLDQVIVSGSLITGNDLNYVCNSFEVFKPKLIVTQSGKYEGAPFPTYGGRKYLGGYSDHYPVIAKFKVVRSSK